MAGSSCTLVIDIGLRSCCSRLLSAGKISTETIASSRGKRRGQAHFVLKLPLPSRVPILYVILGVLALISVVPMYFYSAQVEAINRERLITNERLLQNTVTRSLADEISQHQESLRMMLANLSSALQVASGGDITGEHVEAPELRALLENFVSSSHRSGLRHSAQLGVQGNLGRTHRSRRLSAARTGARL